MPTKDVRESAKARLELVKAWIMQYWSSFYQSPTARELATQFNTSTSVVSAWLIKLENQQWIEPRIPGRSRDIIPHQVAILLQTLNRETISEA